ncbi:MAG: polyribonucleotide nucleotidyltransferase [Desulforudis sp.]|jgi:polyribonucleotide nucleotidyltransferase|nr:MAG: polyribonucleotide nucleotidyltransferase [Desulforudis sp.]
MPDQGVIKREIEISGRVFSLETGRVANQAHGAVLARYGDTVVLVTATYAEAREGLDFFPLLVDYEERHYAVGRIPGSFMKREGRPGEKAILSARLTDRSIRPLFPKHFKKDVQVVATVMSVDQDCAPVLCAMNGASAALSISEIPFQGPMGAVIIGMVDGELVVNPDVEQLHEGKLHLVVAGTREAINMVEAGASEVSEEKMLEALALAHDEIRKIIGFIEDFRNEALKVGLAKPDMELPLPEVNEALIAEIRATAYGKLDEAAHYCRDQKLDKLATEGHLRAVKSEMVSQFLEQHPEDESTIKNTVDALEKEAVRKMVLNEQLRIDGRRTDEIRKISVDVGLLPRTHGTGLFKRGQTQVLSVVTLGAVRDEQIIDGLDTEETRRFLHHYNFPSFSTGETKPIRTPGRREIGHGALAGRAIEAVLPSADDFPYTIRIVSEVLESNGSTSMGSVCGSTLALMDAGVPIKAPVAGIAMGLVKDEDKVAVLTDIQGMEDHLGDMDFKVAGTREGITALQMDIKISGVTGEVLARALTQAKQARLFILDRIQELIPEPRRELSPHAPRIIQTIIDPDKIRDIIGPGGKTIRRITEETGVGMDVEDDGRVFITSPSAESAEMALKIVEAITGEVNVGQVYLGRVVKVMDFGCFVEVIPGIMGLPGKEGLVHISQLAHTRVAKVEDVVKEGDQILVKAIGYDNQGRLKLSKKEAMDPPEGGVPEPPSGGGGRDFRSDRRPGRPRPFRDRR